MRRSIYRTGLSAGLVLLVAVPAHATIGQCAGQQSSPRFQSRAAGWEGTLASAGDCKPSGILAAIETGLGCISPSFPSSSDM